MVYCVLVASHGVYYHGILSVSPMSLLASWMTWIRPWLCCFLYLSRVCLVWIFILVDIAMGSKSSSSMESTRPPDEGIRFVLVGARRVFASSTNTCYLSGRHLCFAHCSHPGCLSGASGSRVRSFFEWELWLFPPRWLLERWHCFCCKTYQGEEQMQEEDL